jgi:hypothetical protein
LAAALMKDPNDRPRRELLERSHTALRVAYEKLLLVSESMPSQQCARDVLRVAWNERQEGLGQERKRPRDPAYPAPAKALRNQLRKSPARFDRNLGCQATWSRSRRIDAASASHRSALDTSAVRAAAGLSINPPSCAAGPTVLQRQLA